MELRFGQGHDERLPVYRCAVAAEGDNGEFIPSFFFALACIYVVLFCVSSAFPLAVLDDFACLVWAIRRRVVQNGTDGTLTGCPSLNADWPFLAGSFH